MRLAPDQSLVEFRRAFNEWLDSHLPSPEVVAKETRNSSAHLPDWARRFQRELFEAGYLVPGWPPELGGRNATPQEQMVYFEVVAERQVPRSCNPQGLSICAASVVEFGTDEQKEKFVVPTLKGEVTWCLGMSEPNAGSDLASLTTKAERRDGHFVVNGQKVWTSGAQDADYCLCFVRTDPDAPKHKGISTLIIDMTTPGITCRSLPELTDPYHADFNEVFFTDVEVPEENLLGELNHGWTVSQGSLRHERGMLWIKNANGWSAPCAAWCASPAVPTAAAARWAMIRGWPRRSGAWRPTRRPSAAWATGASLSPSVARCPPSTWS